MRQPKYKFGDKFSKEVMTEYEGNSQKTIVTHYVVYIRADSSERGLVYQYKLASSLPSAYHSPKFQTEEISEDKVGAIYGKDEL